MTAVVLALALIAVCLFYYFGLSNPSADTMTIGTPEQIVHVTPAGH